MYTTCTNRICILLYSYDLYTTCNKMICTIHVLIWFITGFVHYMYLYELYTACFLIYILLVHTIILHTPLHDFIYYMYLHHLWHDLYTTCTYNSHTCMHHIQLHGAGRSHLETIKGKLWQWHVNESNDV